jgi:hypothetical protein
LALVLNVFARHHPEGYDLPNDLLVAARAFWQALNLNAKPKIYDIIIALNLTRIDPNLRPACIQYILLNPEAALEAIQHLFGVTDPRKLYNVIQLNWPEVLGDPFELKNLGALNPLLLHLHPPLYAGASLDFFPAFVHALGSAQPKLAILEKNEELARELRLLQWDIFTRVPSEDRFRSAKQTKGVTGLPSDEFLREYTRKTREAHQAYYLGVGGRRLRERSSFDGIIGRHADLDLFRSLLDRASSINDNIYGDLIQSLSSDVDYRSSKARETRQLICVLDGELTFFSLLWTLRRVGLNILQAKGWLGEEGQLERPIAPAPIPAKFIGIDSDNASIWGEVDVFAYFDWLGLIIEEGDTVIFTRRWRSFLNWSKSEHIKESFKALDFEREPKLNRNQQQNLKTLRRLLAWVKQESPRAFCYEAKRLDAMSLLLGLVSVFSASLEESGLGWDVEMIRLCRVPFLPIEIAFRAYQPFETTLLIALLGSHPESDGRTLAPVALGFATVVGEVPAMAETSNANLRWAGPYWSFLSAMGNEVSARYLADTVYAATDLARLRLQLKSSKNPDAHKQIEDATLELTGEAVQHIFRFLEIRNEERGYFFDCNGLRENVKNAFKTLISASRRPTSLLLWLLAFSRHRRMDKSTNPFILSDISSEAFHVWSGTITSKIEELLDFYCFMCDELFRSPKNQESRDSNLISARLMSDKLVLTLSLDFDGLVGALIRRTGAVLNGHPLDGAVNTASFAVWRFWAASAICNTGDKDCGLEFLNSTSVFRIERAGEQSTSNYTQLSWQANPK